MSDKVYDPIQVIQQLNGGGGGGYTTVTAYPGGATVTYHGNSYVDNYRGTFMIDNMRDAQAARHWSRGHGAEPGGINMSSEERKKMQAEADKVDEMREFIKEAKVGLKADVDPLFHDKLKPAISALSDAFSENHVGGTPTITGGNRDHSIFIAGSGQVSHHRLGLAMDVGFNAWRTGSANDAIRHFRAVQVVNSLREQLGNDYDVIYEHSSRNSSNDHIHIEYQPLQEKGLPMDSKFFREMKIKVVITDRDRDREIQEDRRKMTMIRANIYEDDPRQHRHDRTGNVRYYPK